MVERPGKYDLSSKFVNAENKVKKGIGFLIVIENKIPHHLIQKTVNYIKANQVLTKEKTGVPGGIL